MGVSEGRPSLTEPYLARPRQDLSESRPLHGFAALIRGSPPSMEGNGAVPRQGAAQTGP